VGDLLDLGTTMNLLRKSGANYSFGDTRLGQGRENAKEFLKTHSEIADELERQVREVASGGNSQDVKAVETKENLPELEEVAVGTASD
jgi:recombination protein RecA